MNLFQAHYSQQSTIVICYRHGLVGSLAQAAKPIYQAITRAQRERARMKRDELADKEIRQDFANIIPLVSWRQRSA